MRAPKFTMVAAGAAIALSLAGQAAQAQPGPGGPGPGAGGWGGGPRSVMMQGGPGADRGWWAAAPGEYAAKRLDWLKTELQINAGQEAVWTKYANTAKGAAESMAARMKEIHAAPPPATTPERLDQRLTAMKAGLASMESMTAATKELYAALTPEQQKVADRWLGRMGRHGRGWGAMGPGMEYGPGPGRGPGWGPGTPPGAAPGAGPRS